MAEKKDKAQQQLDKVADYKRTFTEPHGKRVLLDMMKTHGMLEPGFDPNPYEMARMAGERNVLYRILTLLEVDLEQMQALIKERRENAY